MPPPEPIPREVGSRLDSLERDVRDLHLALERNILAVETLAAEVTQLRGWIESTSQSTKEIAESRIWRTLTSIARLFVPAPAPVRVKSAPAADRVSAYDRWIADFESSDAVPDASRFTFRPRITVVGAHRDGASGLPACTTKSVEAQSYPDWELRDDGAGEYLAIVEPGAILARDAFLCVVAALQDDPECDVFYTDEDRIDASGRRHDVFFKPDWSPDLLRSMNYVGSLLVVRGQTAAGAGLKLPVASTYEALLALSATTARIRRVARVLCHRGPETPQPDPDSDRRTLEDHLRATCLGCFTEPDSSTGRWRVRYPAPPGAGVSIIVPSGGKVDLLAANLTKLDSVTEYRPYEIVVADNSLDDAVERFVREWEGGARVRYMDWRKKAFNFAAVCNAGAAGCDTPFLLFLNDDVSPVGPGWLQAMVELGARPEVGAVGARLLFPDGRIQHAGIALGLFGHSGHLFKGFDSREEHACGLDRAIRDVSAVTGACLLVRADVFRRAGGFDEDHYPVDFNDIDLCLRIRALGYRVLYTPYAELCHHESTSRRLMHRIPSPAEVGRFRRTWAGPIADDPFYNPNLTRAAIDYSPRQRGESGPVPGC